MKRGVLDPDIPIMLLHLVMDLVQEHPDLLHPVLETLHTLFMQDPLWRDTVHHLPEETETEPLTERYHQQLVSLKGKVVPTLANITLATELILQPHFDYAPGLVNTGPNKGTNEDFLKEKLVFTFVQKLDQQDLHHDQELLNQNVNHLKPLMNLWK